jgi:DNA repair protein RecO (recombination protein O)
MMDASNHFKSLSFHQFGVAPGNFGAIAVLVRWSSSRHSRDPCRRRRAQRVPWAIDLRAASFLPTAHALYGVHHLAALCRLLPERDPHRRLFELLDATLCDLGERGPRPAAVRMARFELRLLAELGFGLDLAACVATGATGATADLAYVSPKSGRAVSRAAGEPWRDKLLALPAFLCDGAVEPSASALRDGFALTGFFLARHLFEPRGEILPPARSRFIAAVERGAKEA